MRAWPLFLVSACRWASSCSPRPQTVVISRIVVDMPANLPILQRERDRLRAALTTRLKADRSVRLLAAEHSWDKPQGTANSGPSTHVLQVVWGPPSHPVLDVRLRPTHLGDDELSTAATLPGEGTQLSDALSAFSVAWNALTYMRELDRSSDKRLLAALKDPDMRIQQFAIARLGERRSRLAVKPLCKLLLSQSDTSMLYRIMGALVAIGDVRAVTPLIDIAQKKEAGFLSQVVFAVGAIGGRTARAFLVVLASGHPDEEVQRSARDALDELLQRQPAAHR